MSPRDLLAEAAAALAARPGRAALTILGVVLGVGTFVAVVGLTNTASGQISARFNALTATTVTVTDARSENTTPLPFAANADARAASLNGVDAAGVIWQEQIDLPVHSAPVATTGTTASAPIFAVSAGAWGAIAPRIAQGRTYDAFADSTNQHVVVLGSGAARALGITTLATQPAIFIGDTPYVVMGIIDDTVRRPDLLLGVIVPRGTAEQAWGSPHPEAQVSMVVATRIGAAAQVAAELPYALSPQAIDQVSVEPPPDPRSLRDAIGTDLSGLLFSLAGICLIIGAVGIANTTLVAVLERTGEIGLRRSVGARRRHIAAQIVTESAGLGILGGLVGTSLGILVVLVVALTKQWTPVIDPATLLLAPILGMVTGSLAGLYPAVRAAHIEPTEALRR